jgi:hypothetical protein
MFDFQVNRPQQALVIFSRFDLKGLLKNLATGHHSRGISVENGK